MLKIHQSEVIKIIERALVLTRGTLKADSKSEELECWDSLGQLSILVSLDKHFTGRIAGISEMAEADSVQKILDILERHSIL
jgi:acyl carrier protein